MSTTQDHGDFVFECDGCRDTLAANTSNFDAALNVLRRHRWKPRRRNGELDWRHFCTDCLTLKADRAPRARGSPA